jgi:hypothetical protein
MYHTKYNLWSSEIINLYTIHIINKISVLTQTDYNRFGSDHACPAVF